VEELPLGLLGEEVEAWMEMLKTWMKTLKAWTKTLKARMRVKRMAKKMIHLRPGYSHPVVVNITER
jgi:hypothetical protein